MADDNHGIIIGLYTKLNDTPPVPSEVRPCHVCTKPLWISLTSINAMANRKPAMTLEPICATCALALAMKESTTGDEPVQFTSLKEQRQEHAALGIAAMVDYLRSRPQESLKVLMKLADDEAAADTKE